MEKKRIAAITIPFGIIIFVLVTASPPPRATEHNTLDDIKSFLQNDKTNEHAYTPGFQCLNFTDTLIRNATEKGFECGQVEVYYKGNDHTAHSVVAFYLQDETVFIEPQDDTVIGSIKKIGSLNQEASIYSLVFK